MEQQFPDVSLTEVLADPGLSDVSAVIKVASSTAKSTAEEICDKATTSLMDQGLTTEQLSVIYGGALYRNNRQPHVLLQ